MNGFSNILCYKSSKVLSFGGYFTLFYLFIFNFWVCVLRSEFVFLLFLFKTRLDLNSCDFWFLFLFFPFFFFHLVKIYKLIFLKDDVAFLKC